MLLGQPEVVDYSLKGIKYILIKYILEIIRVLEIIRHKIIYCSRKNATQYTY